jgi:hypothetical protein
MGIVTSLTHFFLNKPKCFEIINIFSEYFEFLKVTHF